MRTKSMDSFRLRPVTTLYTLVSVDGKISTGATDELDFDQDFPTIEGVKEGLQQYYDIERSTDLWSLCSGRTQAKIGANKNPNPPKIPVSFVLVDNHNLTEHGVRYICARSKQCVLVTTNSNHPAFTVREENLSIILQPVLNLGDALESCTRSTGASG